VSVIRALVVSASTLVGVVLLLAQPGAARAPATPDQWAATSLPTEPKFLAVVLTPTPTAILAAPPTVIMANPTALASPAAVPPTPTQVVERPTPFEMKAPDGQAVVVVPTETPTQTPPPAQPHAVPIARIAAPPTATAMSSVAIDDEAPVDEDPSPAAPTLTPTARPTAPGVSQARPSATPTQVVLALVPPVMYQSGDAAAAKLRLAGLDPRTQAVDRFSPGGRGTVAGQAPGAGESVAVGSRVTLLIATGNVEVPNVIGLPEVAAWQALQAVGLDIRTTRVATDKVLAGLAAAVQPPPGAVVPDGARVTLTVSQGR
jgi:serine/threonine-protein kinase